MPTQKPTRAKPPPPVPETARKRQSPTILWGALLVAAVLAVGGAYLLWPSNNVEEVVAPTPTEPGLVARVESLYNDIYVYKQAGGNYVLMFGAKRLRYVESIVNPADPLDLPVYYTQSMTVGLAYAENLRSAMIIGLGGGRTAWYHHKSVPDMKMTAVELDPEVARIADRYFAVRQEPGFDLAIEDGRVYLTGSEERYDIILVDAYRGPFVPFHLLTTEFYREVAEHLQPGGVAVQNVEPTTMLFDSAVATIRSAFEHVLFFEGSGNIVVLAYNGPEKDELTLRRMAGERQAKYGFRYALGNILDRRFSPVWNAATKPLTDDFAPVEYLKAVARHNEKQK